MFHRLLFDATVVFVFLAMMMMLVLAHEYGHYLFARLCKMGVEEFSIGFGNPLVCTYRVKETLVPISQDETSQLQNLKESLSNSEDGALGFASRLEGGQPEKQGTEEIVEANGQLYLKEKTRFTIRAWPLGGFVRIKGMVPDEENSEVHIPGGFYQKSPFKRFLVLLAGPLFSVAAGVLLLVPYNMVVGQPKADHTPVIAGIAVGMPAMRAGLKLGDKVVSINGHKITDFYQILTLVRQNGVKPLSVVVARNNKDLTFRVTPELDSEETPVIGPDLEPTGAMAVQTKIGIVWNQKFVPLAFFPALENAAVLPWITVSGLADGILHPAQLKNNVGGPETMIKLTANATQQGFLQILLLSGLLSVSLGIFNLLPFPPLDGGQMMISIVEMLRRGKRLSLKVQSLVFSTGLAVVGMLVATVLVLDFMNGLKKPPPDIKIITSKSQQTASSSTDPKGGKN